MLLLSSDKYHISRCPGFPKLYAIRTPFVSAPLAFVVVDVVAIGAALFCAAPFCAAPVVSEEAAGSGAFVSAPGVIGKSMKSPVY
jgi:hypothetical protein